MRGVAGRGARVRRGRAGRRAIGCRTAIFWSIARPSSAGGSGARGWIGMTWPRRYGGGERSMLERYVVTEELLAAGAPVGAHWIADRQSAPLLLRYGTEEQRQEFLPGIARGESLFLHRHERARHRLRSGLGAHPRGAGRGRLGGHRRQGVDELCARIAFRDHAGAHRGRRRRSARGAEPADPRPARAGRDDPADHQSRRRPRFQRGRDGKACSCRRTGWSGPKARAGGR